MKKFFGKLSLTPRFFIPMSALKGINVAKRDPSITWYDGPCLFEALDELEFKALKNAPFVSRSRMSTASAKTRL